MKVAAFTGGINQASSRFRVRQYIDVLKQYDITIDDFFSSIGKYPPAEKSKRLIWGIGALSERLTQVVNVNLKGYDCIILQRELISTLKTFEDFIPRPRILDVDDAIYLHKRRDSIRKIAESVDAIICGNKNLAETFGKWNKKIDIVPTAVDTRKYVPSLNRSKIKEKLTMGWVGTSGGFKYLYEIEKALRYILKRNKDVELRVVSDTEPKFSLLDKYRYIKWDDKIEVENFQSIDIGLMPLIDDEWSRGKCSYKMLLHMSTGSPVVVSPVGMNQEVLNAGNVGFGATDYYSDWVDSLEYLVNNETRRIEMGKTGRQVVQDNYSLEVLSEKMSRILLSFS